MMQEALKAALPDEDLIEATEAFFQYLTPDIARNVIKVGEVVAEEDYRARREFEMGKAFIIDRGKLYHKIPKRTHALEVNETFSGQWTGISRAPA